MGPAIYFISILIATLAATFSARYITSIDQGQSLSKSSQIDLQRFNAAELVQSEIYAVIRRNMIDTSMLLDALKAKLCSQPNYSSPTCSLVNDYGPIPAWADALVAEHTPP